MSNRQKKLGLVPGDLWLVPIALIAIGIFWVRVVEMPLLMGLSFCPTERAYIGYWDVMQINKFDGAIVPFTDSTFYFGGSRKDTDTAMLSVPYMMIQPRPKFEKSSIKMKLSCDQDSIVMVDRRYGYWTGRYLMAILPSRSSAEKDTLVLRSHKMSIICSPVTSSQNFQRMAAKYTN